PEKTFNLRVFRFVDDGAGGFLEQDQEVFSNLTMDTTAARYAPNVVTQGSRLISLVDPGAAARVPGVLVGGLVLGANEDTEVAAIIAGGQNMLRISVAGSAENVDLTGAADVPGVAAAINLQFGSAVTAAAQAFGGRNLFVLQNDTTNDLTVQPTGVPGNDFAAAMQLGTANGGLEFGADSLRRPLPSGFFFAYDGANLGTLGDLAVLTQADITSVSVNGTALAGIDLVTTDPADLMIQGLTAPGAFTLNNLREKLQQLVLQFNAVANATPNFDWAMELQGLRVVIKPTAGNANRGVGIPVATTPDGTLAAAVETANSRYYSLGPSGAGNFQTDGSAGDDGVKPLPADYATAFEIIDRDVDIFNLLILCRDADDVEDRAAQWGAASVFAQQRRAFLLVDPPATWRSISDVTSGTPHNIGTLRQGLVKDHAAIYWPRIRIIDPATGLSLHIDPSGSIAGVAARIDGNRGVWKAPAGLEAGILGIVGSEHTISDPENGVINPQAVNAIRVFPNGIVSWGARTMDGFDNSGNNDYKYVPVRRLALFLEESLYRGLQFAVFEPNDEPLWAQIRLAAGAFMNNLFRRGAFQGQKASDAYFVKCDAETTTQNDINLGIVNVIIGFAPLKPAEFVIITIRQLAGQVQT
ncbi:MAG: phage tail sheath family protein, partial [Geminicoccaceae bacterium]